MKPYPRFRSLSLAAALASPFLFSSVAGATGATTESPPAVWISSWFASPQPVWDALFALPTGMPGQLQNQTLQETVKLSLGGQRLRVVLSNRYGSQALVIGAAQVARIQHGMAVEPASNRALRFGGQPGVTIAPGAQAVSDPVDLPVDALTELAISTYFPQATPVTTFHWGAQQTALLTRGNTSVAQDLAGATPLEGRAFLAGVWVQRKEAAPVVVAFGDSVTDGNGSTPGLNRRWPDFLARRLAGEGVGVVNAGISGARVWSDKMGVNAMARFDADVLSQPGVRTVVLMMGINDIGWPGSAFAPGDPAMTAPRLAEGYRQLAEAAHARNVRIVAATIPPFEGALEGTPVTGYYSPAKDAVRREVNQWIRGSGVFDAVVDFDALLQDPAHPARLLPAYDSGDHLHPGDAGYEAMAKAVDDAALFGRKTVERRH
ncbi:SGNH/GDSL hydrolase family protein [Achromobacter seleniivolatilans]|uniref:SGNH/GDSL hydrolase family protein n=1 Tax=Achromobacter seleniivolatilans TaxID=3047478 RepID=A0ABY9M453_9BURK|nr:SGNH/GDSL hydrolase family protein [Achromobacter sp. R39]WMD21788.1 SGNH/GDSL hydrolase family protein [Achromobacter sp. R39]